MISEKILHIGHNIEKARKELKYTTVKMAKELNCSQQTISAIEKGEAYGKNLVKYLIFLKNKGVDLNEIFNETY